VAIFRKEDAEVIEVGARALRLQCITFPFTAFVIGSNMMLQTIGRSVKASIAAIARNGIFFVPAILILPTFMGLFGVQVSQAVADVLAVLLCIPMTFAELKDMKRREKAAESAE